MANVTELPNSAAIKEEAGAWLVRIDQGNLNTETIAEFKAWVSRSDFHREYLEKLAGNWDDMALLQELADLFPLAPDEPVFDSGGSYTDTTSYPSSFLSRVSYYLRPSITGSAALVAIVVIAMLAFMQPSQQSTELITQIGQQRNVELQDGTVVVLNTNSHVTVEFTEQHRVVHLLNGEASFDVAKNPQRPFMVYAGEGLVWAVGTAFNVRYTSEVVDVTVTEGTVKVYTQMTPTMPMPDLSVAPATTRLKHNALTLGEREAVVGAGQSIQYDNIIKTAEPVLSAEVIAQKVAWHQGALVFTGEPLAQALQEIARYTDKELVIADSSIANIRIGGHFKTDDINGLLTVLSQSFNLDVQQVTENRIQIARKQPD